jgi:hypothetical protein
MYGKPVKNNSSTAFFVNPDAKSFLGDCPALLLFRIGFISEGGV